MLYALECGVKGKCSEENLASLSYESLLTIYYGFDFLNKNKASPADTFVFGMSL